MNIKKVFFCLLILSSCSARSSRIQHEGLPYIISLQKEVDRIQPTGLTNIGSTITYIPLETSDKSLLAKPSRIIITDTYISVYSSLAKNGVLLFDHSGGFVRQISRDGRGPGEYIAMYGMSDHCFSPDGEKIYLLVNGFDCLEYDVEGKYFKTHKLDSSFPIKMLPIDENLFVFYPENQPRRNSSSVEQSLVISDLNNNIQKTYKNHHKRIQFPSLSFRGGSALYSHQGDVRFKELGADTLFTVTMEELIPYAVLNLGNKGMPVDIAYPVNSTRESLIAALAQYSSKFYLQYIVEDIDNLHITLSDPFINNRYGYYDKQSYTVKVIGDEGFQNDIDGGLPFFPKYIYNDSILVDYVDAYDLREHVLNSNVAEMRRLYGQKYDDLVKLAESLDDEDNPILVFVTK